MQQQQIKKKFCFIGNVDSGKSTTSGHLYALTGQLSEHELSKIKSETEKKYQMWSRVLDIYTEEREKGKTHEFNLLSLEYQGEQYELIDTPGHKIYIRSLIEGMSLFNPNEVIAILVVSAAKGEFEAGWNGGQTKEDIILARSIGIKNMIVLVNKMDTVNWMENNYNNIKNEIKPFIKNCKFDTFTFIPISGYDGIGLIDLENMPSWYSENEAGFCLMDTIKSIVIKENITNTIDVVEEYKQPSFKKMQVIIKILQLPSKIATIGFNCILHYDGEEYDVVFDDVELIKKVPDKKPIKFLKENDSGTIIIQTSIPINKKNATTRKNTSNLIFRYGTITIGFGKIVKIFE